MKTKLRSWLAEHEGQGWSDALPDIALGIQLLQCEFLRKTEAH